ncbi:MAG: formate hydrogenlyase subunit 4 [gamma proteobacterium symbiont of Stewartia floridana]|nr:NADH-quinone oxidoreductase subunit H [Candidatus Thiodiazotropha taylori]MCG7962714.1 NADH-quinone oxidoreductase subunit H [Candidatus Thiodiazotropha endolucinida]RLW52412.1 MAG: formate hydrogenlyase subunit 4 [gamma proteobacterium symbiont of Stewartia floridana]MCG7869638.1 NADH-quinone oxidoreductase subunit H [Candidatus Thiodiazotropha taylori]MCG7893710.1 NADH-quinone oxidoreductase subunit H [Candidatus Thiodiazotropha taylori]
MAPIELLIELTLMPLIAFIVGMMMVLMMRRIAARIQRRIGPPFFQPLYDIVKLHGKRTQVSHGLIHDIGIVMAMGGYIAAETLLPVPGMNGIAEKGGLITLLYLMMIPSLGLALGVGQCANPNGSIGIARALTAMLAYDIPLVIVIFGVAYAAGTTNLVEIIATQQAGGFATWGVVEMPLLAIAGLIAMHASLGKQPFEIYIAPAEIATGPMVEMSGKYLGGLFVMQCFQLYTTSVLYVSLFLGGGTTWFDFLIKSFLVLAIPVSIAYLFPRYRTEDLLRLMWKWPVMLGLIGLAFVM